MQPESNIFLVGMMGAGKTTVGKALAKRLDRRFLDTDAEIVRRTGVTIPVIFEVEGEAGFRQRESVVLRELAALDNLVLATGGGIVLAKENRETLRRHGIVVYLRASVENLWQRTRNDRNRPLLQTADPFGTLQALFQQRDPLYLEVADIVVDTGNRSVSRLVTQLVAKLASYSRPTV